MEQKQTDIEPGSFTVDVAHAFEVMAETLTRLERRIVSLEELVVLQQQAVNMLSEAVKGHQKIIEADHDWKPRPERASSVN